MTTLSIAETLKFANLQMAAEALYGFDANAKNTVLTPGQTTFGEMDSAMLQLGNRHASKFTAAEVALSKLTDDWTVVEHKSNTETGFSGTLFKRNGANEYDIRSNPPYSASMKAQSSVSRVGLKSTI